MVLADSHAHIYSEQFDQDRIEVIERSLEVGVSKIYMPNVDHESIDRMLEVAAAYPKNCFPMMGLHPCSVGKDYQRDLYEVEAYLSKDGFCAVGEIGTDLYWDKTYFEQQKEAFKIQCELAIHHRLPIVVHCRESITETIDLVKEFQGKGLYGVFHCFTGSLDQAKEIVSLGFKLGIGGVSTFKNGGIVPVIKEMGIDSLLLETDSPYLAPVPHRGKRNEPSFIKLVAQKIAIEREMEFDEVAELTTRNTTALFTPR